MALLPTGYAADGSRLVAGVVAVSPDKKKVLVVESTTRRNHWVLPKGGYETDEPSAEDAAARGNTSSFPLCPRLLRTFSDWHAYSPRIQAKLGKKLALPVTLVGHSARFETKGLARVGRIRCTTSSNSGSRGKSQSGQR